MTRCTAAEPFINRTCSAEATHRIVASVPGQAAVTHYRCAYHAYALRESLVRMGWHIQVMERVA